jgi:hypothetical protein
VENVSKGAIYYNSEAGIYYWLQLGGVYDKWLQILVVYNYGY